MKTKFYRRVGSKNVKFNISKSGISTSFKLGPITINPQRNAYSINTPIKGLSLRGKLANKEAGPASNRVKMDGAIGFVPFFTELRASLVDNKLNNLVPYTDTLISECNNELGVDISLFADTIEALEEGLRTSDAKVDKNIYKVLDKIKEAFNRKTTANDMIEVVTVAAIIVITLLCLFA